MKRAFALCFVSAALSCAADYSRIDADVSELPAERRFLRELVLSRAWTRPPPSDAAQTLSVKFQIDGSLSGDDAVVTVADGRATVRGGRFRALVFGAGTLLRAIRYGERTFSLPDGVYRFAPAKKYRIAYLARHFNNWYLKASPDEFLRYIEDLALWGINGFQLHLEYPAVDMVWSSEGDRRVFDAVSAALGERLKALDVDLLTFGGDNCATEDMPPEFRAVPDKKPRGATQYNVCPAKPGALEYLLKLKRDALEKYRGMPVGGLLYWPFDEGGCACEACAPWGGNGYVRLIERMAKMNKAAYPDAKHLVSTWFFRKDDWPGFYRYLENQDWIDMILVDSPGEFPKYPLENPVPKELPIVTFPEISMWGRFPWGGTGANPMPARFERIFRVCERAVQGFMLYSEGIYEDLNKIVVNGLYVDPSRHAGEVVADYAKWEMPGCAPADVVRLCEMLEDIYETKHGKGNGRKSHRFATYVAGGGAIPEDQKELKRRTAVAREAAALADRIDAAILPRMRSAWRWRQLYLRAKIDASAYSARTAHTPETLAAYSELTALYHAEKQVERLYDETWRGYTCPPLADCENMQSRQTSATTRKE